MSSAALPVVSGVSVNSAIVLANSVSSTLGSPPREPGATTCSAGAPWSE